MLPATISATVEAGEAEGARQVLSNQCAGVAELVDARDLKSLVPHGTCRFDSGPPHQYIRKDILAYERAAYGEQIVHALSRQLTGEYGRGFSRPNLFHMIRFAETFPDRKIVYALSRQLGRIHMAQSSLRACSK